MHWKKKCDRCLLSKKEHKKPYPTWWQWANIKPHEWVKPKKAPVKRHTHMAPVWNFHILRVSNSVSRKVRLPLCFDDSDYFEAIKSSGYGYNPDDDPFEVTCKKCIRWYLEGTSAKIEGDAKRARIQKRKEKKERLARKREERRKSKASRKTGKKLGKGKEREVRLHSRKSKRRRSD